MGHRSSTDAHRLLLDDYIKKINAKKKDIRLTESNCPLDAEALKTLMKTLLEKFTACGLLLKHSPSIQKFIQGYDFSNFSGILTNFTIFTITTKDGFSSLSRGKQAKEVKKGTSSVSITRATIQSQKKPEPIQNVEDPMTSSNYIFSLEKRLLDFFKNEIVRRDNFLFELTQFFGEIYAKYFEEDIKKFEPILSQIDNNKISPEFRLILGEKNAINELFNEAKKQIKEFEEFLKDSLEAFFWKISLRVNGDDSLVPKNGVLASLAQKLLFRKTKCYQTFFSIIRYKAIEEEINLKNSFSRYKYAKPKDFDIKGLLCLEREAVPYRKVIETVHNLELFKTPDDKLKLLVQIRKQIRRSIDDYRIKQNLQTGQSILAGDDTPLILTYCIARSANHRLQAHEIFIETFLNQERLYFDEEGYCFATFVTAIKSLLRERRNEEINIEDQN